MENKESILAQFSTEITKLAKEGLLDPLSGEKKKLRELLKF